MVCRICPEIGQSQVITCDADDDGVDDDDDLDDGVDADHHLYVCSSSCRKNRFFRDFVCGSTLVAPKWAISAAHCTRVKISSDLIILVIPLRILIIDMILVIILSFRVVELLK